MDVEIPEEDLFGVRDAKGLGGGAPSVRAPRDHGVVDGPGFRGTPGGNLDPRAAAGEIEQTQGGAERNGDGDNDARSRDGPREVSRRESLLPADGRSRKVLPAYGPASRETRGGFREASSSSRRMRWRRVLRGMRR